MTRHEPVSCQMVVLPFLAAMIVGIAAWQCVRPAAIPDAPPATATSTPTLLVVVAVPIPRQPSPPPHTPMPPEPVLTTPTRTPAPPTETATATATPTIETTKRPMEQKGELWQS
jgi:hypothetical protein